MLRRFAEASGVSPKHLPVRQETDFSPRTARNDNAAPVVKLSLIGNRDPAFDFGKALIDDAGFFSFREK
jgi:hypothetical protein